METFALTKPLRILQKMDNGTYDVVKLESNITIGDAGFSNGEVRFYIDDIINVRCLVYFH